MFSTFSRGTDKRHTIRSRVCLAARYTSANLTLDGEITDVSADGVFFRSEFLDDRGELARLSIQLPTRPGPLELRGEVRWVSDAPAGGGMGLRLIDVSLEDRKTLANVLHELAAEAHGHLPRAGNA
jgi:hypothetical protein